MTAREEFMQLLLEERLRQDAKHGTHADKSHKSWSATISEEYLEVLEEVMIANTAFLRFVRAVDETKEPLSPAAADRIRKELVQVAALCFKMYEKYPAIQVQHS